ncbi:hypothetical protein EDB85DRAFT_2141182 [Lactarius pseudohatsudake]|nr:hypothetical protein EDB85DRAFT_2141182 [Lactarius pseudohatsudake]
MAPQQQGALVLRHATTPTRRPSNMASGRCDTDSVPERHDTDAALQQHSALALRHDTALSHHDTDAAPQQHGALALQHARHDTDAVPQQHSAIMPRHRFGALALRLQHGVPAL